MEERDGRRPNTASVFFLRASVEPGFRHSIDLPCMRDGGICEGYNTATAAAAATASAAKERRTQGVGCLSGADEGSVAVSCHAADY
jgi:hypothetical protein